MLHRFFITIIFFLLFISSSQATVILLYHHVSESTPPSTSISPKQFENHLQYLHDEGFVVLPLPKAIKAIRNNETLPNKSVVITFDDAYTNNLTHAKPLLDKFNYPYTIFVNPVSVQSNSSLYLSWEQLSFLARSTPNEVTIANHGFTHDSFVRPTAGVDKSQWFKSQTEKLLEAEQLISKHTGQNWRFFAYPYGEYSTAIQQWLTEHDFVGFTQQSGALGTSTDLTIVPRFPASIPYDKLKNLKDKIHSLPLTLMPDYAGKHSPSQTIFKEGELTSVTFTVNVKDFYRGALTCYVSGLGKQELNWISKTQFTIEFSGPLKVGRARSNCTAASISKPGRFYWFSQPWFITNADGSWFPLT